MPIAVTGSFVTERASPYVERAFEKRQGLGKPAFAFKNCTEHGYRIGNAQIFGAERSLEGGESAFLQWACLIETAKVHDDGTKQDERVSDFRVLWT